jgi:SAM-dependent methyltransferase
VVLFANMEDSLNMTNINTRNKNCTICNSSKIKFLFQKNEIQYFKCNKCFFVFSSPDVNINFQEDITDFEEVYMQYFDQNICDNKNFNFLLTWMQSMTSVGDKKIIDVGCGSGKFVKHLAKEHIDIFGVEPSRPLYDRFLSKNINFVNSSIKEYVVNSSVKYDIVTLLDVLEHVEYPSEFIDDVIKLHSPGGHIIIEIPLYGSLPSLLLGKKWHFFNKYHLSYFSKKRLFKLMQEKGYKVVKYKYRGKYFSLEYFIKYIYFFVLRKSDAKIFYFLKNKIVYLNTYDILLVCFRKEG